MQWIQSLPDGWSIYVWMIAGAAIIIGAVFAIRWAHHNEQFDEDIKYLVFDENDRDKMSPEDFAKSREVVKQQIKRREEILREKASQRMSRHEKG